MVDDYLITEKTPLRDEIIDIMQMRPKLKKRRLVTERILNKIGALLNGVDKT